MRGKKTAIALLCLCASLILAQGAAASPAPAWHIAVNALPTNFAPGAKGTFFGGPELLLVATNSGAAPTSGPVTIAQTLPKGLTATAPVSGCEVSGQTVSCTHPDPIDPGRAVEVTIVVHVDPLAPEESLLATWSVEGGGPPAAAGTTAISIDSSTPPFDFLPGTGGFSAPLSEEDGGPATQAGSHPYQLSVSLGFPTEKNKVGLGAAGHLYEASADLPRGTIANPAASSVLCTEAQLTAQEPGCPDASQVGTATVLTVGAGIPEANTAPLYNMVPPPGSPAEFAFDAVGSGLFPHISGEVRSDGDFGLSGVSRDILALPLHPIFGVRLDFWGDPASPAHDRVRGRCASRASTESCPLPPAESTSTAFLTLPGECSGVPTQTKAHARSWEEPGVFKEATYESADLAGDPVSVSGCNQLKFEPSISSQPTTDLADSPSGLDFVLHQPQDTHLGNLSTAALKDAVVTLPAGMAVNPAQADGLAACSQAQIGYHPESEHFDKHPNDCPDAAKLGTVQVTTPLLAQIDSQTHKVERDPETGDPIPRPLAGSVYLAEPFDNPLGSLIAIYLAIEDPRSGTVAKLAGKVEPNPLTGQLTTRFEENPELPLEDVALHLFGGARAPLITPLACGTHTTSSALTPWSAPESKDAHPQASFQTTRAPGGGACPSSETQAPNSPAFSAGTIAPQAAAYSPFVLKLSREDGSQRLAKVDATLPPGLSGKLAGVGTCSEAQIAQAKAREAPQMGALEKESPSCPSSSRVGEVDVSAGAGPSPLHVQGTAYLSGPYKGAPLSMAIVTPAVAGPFDLGAVVVRTALYVNPESAQIHAVSDPLPQIIQGIPLDVRSITVKLNRPDFTLNPTSCDPMSISGAAGSSLGQSAALSSPFQVGGCSSLPFKPKLSLKLKGGTKRAGHPKLVASLKAKPGEANIAAASVQLPRSAFLDQAHIRTICTRVQFAADICPKGSIYGTASATTPLLDQPLTGNVYLRSSNHKLPDLVVALKGPASLPIEIDLAGKTDSVKGALRNSFEAVPDAPVSKFRLELFGGKRGLVVNSRDLCKHPYRAKIRLDGQNGKVFDTDPVVESDCRGKARKHGKRHRRG